MFLFVGYVKLLSKYAIDETSRSGLVTKIDKLISEILGTKMTT